MKLYTVKLQKNEAIVIADFAQVQHSNELNQTLAVWRPTSAATWWTLPKYNVMLDSGLLAPCYENMMSSTKLKVLNVSQCRQRRTEPRLQVTDTKIRQKLAVQFSSYASKQTNEQTDKQTYSSQYSAPLQSWSNSRLYLTTARKQFSALTSLGHRMTQLIIVHVHVF